MAQVQVRVGYRPLRIGWCIRDGDFDAFRSAITLTHTLWGGRFNPVVLVDDEEYARAIVSAHVLDALYAVTDDDKTRAFATSFPHLRWPIHWDSFFIEAADQHERLATVLDVEHVFERLRQARRIHGQRGEQNPAHISWDQNDPLADVLLCSFGKFSDRSQDVTQRMSIGKDYLTRFKELLEPDQLDLAVDAAIPAGIDRTQHASRIIGANLTAIDWPGNFMNLPGICVGDVDNLQHLVLYWNLRAAKNSVYFLDVRYLDRLSDFCRAWMDGLARPSAGRIHGLGAVWYLTQRDQPDESVERVLQGVAHSQMHLSKSLWSMSPPSQPARLWFGDTHVITSTDDTNEHRLTLQLPEPPFLRERAFHTQHVVATTKFQHDLATAPDVTFRVPHIVELNEFVGRNSFSGYYNKCRIQRESIDFICCATDGLLYLKPVERTRLLARMFEQFGITAKPSDPGLVAARLIKQMGGIRECQFFKLAGVRKLIRDHGPQKDRAVPKHFTRSGAIEHINQVVKSKPNFGKYENLAMGQGNKKLTAQFVFDRLLEKNVFLIGLHLKCPSCNLSFWLAIDRLDYDVKCEMCSRPIKIATQLKDRDWAFRLSGLFAQSDRPSGAISVALTLHQMNEHLEVMPLGSKMIFETAMELSPLRHSTIRRCESDIVLWGPTYHGIVNIVIGECKGRDEITDDDIAKLTSVADAFPAERVHCYIIFSKLSDFSKEEIARCKRAQGNASYKRVIMFTERDLEAEHLYKYAPIELELRSPDSLAEMADATSRLFFLDMGDTAESSN